MDPEGFVLALAKFERSQSDSLGNLIITRNVVMGSVKVVLRGPWADRATAAVLRL
jgi:hypothetical protein